MVAKRNNREHVKSKYIQLNTSKCEACWRCLNVCSHGVIGKVNVLWHKHVRFVNAIDCIGCLKCTKVCTSNAMVQLTNKKMNI